MVSVPLTFFGRFYFYFSLVFYILGGVFNKTIIPLALVGYEMIIAISIISYPTRGRGIIVKYSPIFKTARVAKKYLKDNEDI